MKENFVKQGKSEMHDFVTKAIDDLLDILDSKVTFPTDSNGGILYAKLFSVVQAREQVWLSTTELMDMAEIDRTTNKAYLDKIIQGFKTTWHEMTKIVCMDIGDYNPSLTELLIGQEPTEEEKKAIARMSVTDDRLTSISKAKVLAAKLSYLILDRIEMLENPDAINEELIKNSQSANIIEKFTEN